MRAEEINNIINRYVDPEIMWYLEIMDAKDRGEDTSAIEKKMGEMVR